MRSRSGKPENSSQKTKEGSASPYLPLDTRIERRKIDVQEKTQLHIRGVCVDSRRGVRFFGDRPRLRAAAQVDTLGHLQHGLLRLQDRVLDGPSPGGRAR